MLTTIGVLGALAAGAGTAQAIPDDRVYEIVSPGIEGPGFEPNVTGSGVLGGVRASSTRDAVAYQTLSPAPASSGRRGQIRTYVARRTPGGWETQTVSPESVTDSSTPLAAPRFTAFNFTDDLGKGLFTSQSLPGAPLVPEAPARAVNLYRQDLATGENLLMTPFAPIGSFTEPAAPRVAWASADLKHVVFDVAAQYFPGGPTPGVYAWSEDLGMSIASILPDDSVASQATAGSGPGEAVDQTSDFAGRGFYGSNVGAISEDGSRIYFTAGASSNGSTSGRLFVRRDHGTRNARTVELGLPDPGLPAVPGSNTPKFFAATKDGRRAVFASCGKLTANSTAIANTGTGSCTTFGFTTTTPLGALTNTRRPELYLYDETANGGAGGLTDLTIGEPTGAGVLGIVSATEDLSRIYFAATGVLAPGGTKDKPNLYVWDQQDGTTFVAPLRVKDNSYIVGDAPLWSSVSSPRKNAYMTPDGKHLAFSTYAKVDPAFDNLELGGYDPLRQLYLYTYGQGRPVCVSCARSGRNGSEGTIANQRVSTQVMSFPAVADWTKRSMTDDGSELYFESSDKLVPTDANVATDVYVYRPATRRLELISTGRGRAASFAGASSDGLNVFFRTETSISMGDDNASADLYTARLRRGDVVPDKQAPIDPCQGGPCPEVPPTTILGPSDNVAPAPEFDVAEIDGPMRSSWRNSGRMTLPVTTPGPGTIRVRVRGTIRSQVKAKPGATKKTSAKAAKPKYTVGRATVAESTLTATTAGRHGVPLTLTKAARAQLKRTGQLSMTLDVWFGEAHETVTLILKAPKPKAKPTTKKPAKKKPAAKKKATKKKTASKSKSSSRSLTIVAPAATRPSSQNPAR